MAEKKFTTAILITGNSDGAQKAIKLTQEQLDALDKKTKDSTASFTKWGESIGGAAAGAAKWAAAAGAAAAGGVAVLIKSSIDMADQTGILAGKLGVTTEALSRLQYAAKLSDVSQQSLESGMKRLSRTLTESAAGTGEAAKAFEALGLSAKDLINLPVDQQLGAIGDALNTVENASQKAAIAQQIFGRSGVDLIPILKEGTAGIRSMGDEAERFGAVISGDMAASAMQFNDNLDRLKVAASGLGLSLAEQALPYLESFTEELVALAQDKETMDGIVSGLSLIGEAAVGMATSFGKAGAAIQAWRTTSLEEVQAQIVETVRLMETERKWYQNPEMRRNLDEKLAALMKQRDALKLLVVEQKFANVESGHSAETTKKEVAQRRDAVTVTRALTGATKELTQAEKDRREDEMMAIVQMGEADKGLYEAKKAVEGTTAAIVAQKAEADPWADAMTGAVERIDAEFANAWLNIGGGFDGLLDGMKDALERWLAEMAHALITKPLIMNIGASLGMGGSGMSSLVSGGGLLSKIPGIGGAFSPGGLAPLFGQWGVNSGIMNQSFGAGGMGPPQTSFSLSGLGMNLGAGLAGNYLADSLFSGRDSTGYGSAVGGLAGSWFGPIGTGVGAFVGEAIDRALSGSDFTGKRVKLGIGTGSMVDGGDWENSRTLSSGLRVGNLTRRAGDAGLSDEQINTYLSAFDALDATLTGIARAGGADVDFSKIALAGMPQSYDGGTSGQAFFGSLAKGELRDTLTKAPDEFVRQWLVAIDDELSQRVKGILGDTAGKTAAELIGLFGFAVDIDRLLNMDVLKQAADNAEAATRTIYDLYGDATANVVDLAQTFDGSADSMASLTQALIDQKTIASQLAQQYVDLAAATAGLISDTRQSFIEDTLTRDELYASKRMGVFLTSGALQGETDPAKIAALSKQGVDLTREAWGLLTPEERKAMLPEFLGFLGNFEGQNNSAIASGQELLASREAATAAAVDLELLGTAANVQNVAATKMTAAVDTFAAWVANLPASIQVVVPVSEVNA
jgi:hypothetical protein